MIITADREKIEKIKELHLLKIVTINMIKDELKRSKKLVDEVNAFYKKLGL